MARMYYKGSDLPDALFPDREVYNVDGSQTSEPDDADTVSSFEVCDRCGTIFDDHWKMYRRHGLKVCRLCLDTRKAPYRSPEPAADPIRSGSGGLIVDADGNPITGEY